MKRYNVYYVSGNEVIEKKNISEDEMQSFVDSLHKKDEHLLRIKQIKDRDEEER